MTLRIFDLSERLALVTGSSQGIGFAIAEGLAEAGATVILNGRDEAKLASAVQLHHMSDEWLYIDEALAHQTDTSCKLGMETK